MVEPRILLVGASGMLARALIRQMDAQGVPHTDVDYPQFDLSQPASIRAHITGGHNLVLNAAAWTDVDGAEDPAKYPLVERINGTGVGELAQCCRRAGAMLVHYSTEHVFNGQASQPYPTDHPRDPCNAYGRSKALGESLLAASGCRHLLVRTSWLYAPWGKNFVRIIAELVQTRPSLKVVNDQLGRPTSAEHLAAVTFALLQREVTGIFHVTDDGECTRYDFAVAIAAQVLPQHGPAAIIEPCTTGQFPRPATRPAYGVLDISQTQSLLGPMPAWQDSLRVVLERLKWNDRCNPHHARD